MPNYAQYKEEVKTHVIQTLNSLQCQPILFIGSGFSLRYGGGPTWETLLSDLAARCPLIDRDFAYFKHAAAQRLAQLNTKRASKRLQAELSALKQLGPHAIITTNYDELIEPLFPEYEVVIGQNVFRRSALVIGEIFKIHGSITDPRSMVLTKEDYHAFDRDKKYLSAKLLTYFAEHPLLFIGYSASDPNIKNVLYDMSRMFTPTMALIPSIYILQWDKDQNDDSYPAREHVLEVGDDITVRINSITANSYEWVYQAFAAGGTMEKVDLKALRSLAHRMINLIRTDIPRKNVQVNYEALEHAISNEAIVNLFGVTNLGDPSAANAAHPYTIGPPVSLGNQTTSNNRSYRHPAAKHHDLPT